jgi:hypothetical protein
VQPRIAPAVLFAVEPLEPLEPVEPLEPLVIPVCERYISDARRYRRRGVEADLHLCSPSDSRLWHAEDMAMGLLYLR